MDANWRTAILITLTVWLTAPALASSPFLQQGIDAYNKGQYSEALGLFGAAKGLDFDNPTLHYYMANTLVRMNQKADAIREYKLALDLQPQGKLSQFCEEALRSLGALPALTVGSARPTSPSPATGALVPAPPQALVTQQPKIVSILCGCPLCHRLDLITTDLQSKFGNQILFVRTMQTNTAKPLDPRMTAPNCPTVQLIDKHGQVIREYDGNISEVDLWRDATALAKTSDISHFTMPEDARLIPAAKAIIDEVEARISQDQLRVNEEVRTIESEPRPDSGKSTTLRYDFEKRKREWLEAAQQKINTLGLSQPSGTKPKP